VETNSHLFSFLRGHPEEEGQREAAEAPKDEVIEKFARAVVARRLEAPATLFLELNRPLGFLFSQATFFARPFLGFFLPTRDVEAAAQVLDDPTALDRLMDRIGTLSAEETAQ
jgi:hypothetical protein